MNHESTLKALIPIVNIRFTLRTQDPEACYIKVSESAQDKDVGLGEADSKTSSKRSLSRKLFKTCCMDWGKLIQLIHITMVPEQVKTMKIQDGVQVSRPEELRRHLQL
ncbi:hypothetical protein Tco_0644868 [Tanacetum coccineum]